QVALVQNAGVAKATSVGRCWAIASATDSWCMSSGDCPLSMVLMSATSFAVGLWLSGADCPGAGTVAFATTVNGSLMKACSPSGPCAVISAPPVPCGIEVEVRHVQTLAFELSPSERSVRLTLQLRDGAVDTKGAHVHGRITDRGVLVEDPDRKTLA